MNPLDYVLLAALGGFLIFGFVRGFFRQLVWILGVGGAFVLAGVYHTDLAGAEFMSSIREKNETVALVASFIGIFFAVAAAASVLAALINKNLKTTTIGGADRWLGALLGLGVGVLLLGGIAIGLKEWKHPNGALGDTVSGETKGLVEGLVAGSAVLPHLVDTTLWLVELIPQKGRDEIIRVYEEQIKIFDSKGISPANGFFSQETRTSRNVADPQERPLLNLGAQRRLMKEHTAADEDGKPVPASARNAGAAPAPAAGKE